MSSLESSVTATTAPAVFVDLSRKHQQQQRHLYTTLLAMWWPHPTHGGIRFTLTGEGMVFRCRCGKRLRLSYVVAEGLGLLDSVR